MEPVVQPAAIQPHFSIGLRKVKPKKIMKKVKGCFYPLDPIKFTIYSGHRWTIPNGIRVSNPVKSKFLTLDGIIKFKDIKTKIANTIQNMRFRFLINQWVPPENVLHSINSFYAKQENEWNNVRAIYSKVFKITQILKTLVFNWRIKKCLKNCKNFEDPVTLEISRNPVTIIDFKRRLSFIYDAHTLKKTIENRLLFSDYMFPEPKQPVNILTNEPFTYGQMISLIDQSKKHGYTSWIMDSFKDLNADIELFLFHNRQKLKIEAIKAFFKRSTYIIRETVIDYFNLEADLTDLPDPQITRFIKAYDTMPEMPVVQQWIGITRDYYIARELNEPILIKNATDKTDTTLNTIYKVFLYPVT